MSDEVGDVTNYPPQFKHSIGGKPALLSLSASLCLLFFQNTTIAQTSQCPSIQIYGGSGDGKTDNAAAIQSAISHLPQSGGCIGFPPGKYAISKRITYVLPAQHFSISFLGSGGDSTILYWPTANAGL